MILIPDDDPSALEWIQNASTSQMRAALAVWSALDRETFDEGIRIIEVIQSIV
jgi:hypothetical protein